MRPLSVTVHTADGNGIERRFGGNRPCRPVKIGTTRALRDNITPLVNRNPFVKTAVASSYPAPYRLSVQNAGVLMTKPKGIRIDGKKLQDLRKKQGKTQKGVIAGSTVQLRTYQRAEQGEQILPDLAGQIARLVGAELKDIRADRGSDDKPSNSYRLNDLICVGAGKLLEALQGADEDCAQYEFEINPRSDIAKSVAQFIEFSELHRRLTNLHPADRIRAIGALND